MKSISIREIQAALLSDLIGEESSAKRYVKNESGLGVYRDAYRERLAEVLKEDFAASLSFLSRAETRTVVDDFLRRFRSRSFTLNTLGGIWVRYVRELEWPVYPWFAELTEFEWRRNRAFYSGQFQEGKERGFALLPEIRASLSSALDVKRWGWPVHEIHEHRVPREARPVWLAIWERNGFILQRELSEKEADLLMALLQGTDNSESERIPEIAEVLETLICSETDAAFLQERMKKWAEEGIVSLMV